MQCARISERCFPKDRENRLKIPEPNTAPGRRSNQPERVLKYEPAKIARDAVRLRTAQMKSFEGLAAEEKENREQPEQNTNTERDSRDRALAQQIPPDPKPASHDENHKTGARKIHD